MASTGIDHFVMAITSDVRNKVYQKDDHHSATTEECSDVSNVQGADIGFAHPSSSSARTSRDSGMSIPRALATCRLSRNATLLGSSTGRSAGFARST